MSKKSILILSDSLALPRVLPEFCALNNTWPHLLKESLFFDVHQVSIGGGTINDLLRQVTYYKAINPDIVILQAGIVDCAPRFLTRFEIDLIRKIPLKAIRNFIFRMFNSRQVKKFRKITYTSPTIFEYKLREIKNKFIGSSVFCIGIIPATQEYEQILPGITANITKYNDILVRCFASNCIDMDHFPLSGIMSDHHHLNELGHRYIFESILSRLK